MSRSFPSPMSITDTTGCANGQPTFGKCSASSTTSWRRSSRRGRRGPRERAANAGAHEAHWAEGGLPVGGRLDAKSWKGLARSRLHGQGRSPRSRGAARLACLGRFDLVNHVERAFEERLLDILANPPEPRLVLAVPVADAVAIGERAFVEAERDDEVLVVLAAQVVGANSLRRPALGLPGAAEVVICARPEATGREETDHRIPPVVVEGHRRERRADYRAKAAAVRTDWDGVSGVCGGFEGPVPPAWERVHERAASFSGTARPPV